MTSSRRPRAVVLLGHAERESFNGALADAFAEGWRQGGGELEQLSLGELSFDPVLRSGHRGAQALEPDLERVREAIERADHVAWVFPTYWASPPALVRGLVDRLFLPGWAFRYEKGRALPRGLLAGRSARVISTMDSPSWWYALAHHRAIHATMGTATLTFSGFAPVRFTTVHVVRDLSDAARSAWLIRARTIGERDARECARRAARNVVPPALAS